MPSTSTKPPQILTVDDDPAICKLIERAFKDAGYRTQTAHSAEEMRRKIGDAAMVLLDINLPGANGIDLAREIREGNPHIGIIMVTGLSDDIDRIVGLEVGADDYVCKPFNARELVARVRSVMRRLNLEQSDTSLELSFLDLVVDLEARQVRRGDEEIDLTGHEFKLLVTLAERPKRVFTREELSRTVSDREWYPTDRSVDVLVSKVRKKLERGDTAIIKSLRGVGYQFCVKVEKK